MADKSVGELIAATSVTPTDLFVLEQNGTAKKLTGQTLENWLVSFADGHGGIQSVDKIATNGLVDTYRITLADTTTFDFIVNNGRGINSITKTGTAGLVDTYTISFNDNTSSTFTVTNGAKGDKGDNAYIWVKYASQEPTASSNSFGDLPDDWMGVYFGTASTAPTNWQQYKWHRIKGEKGDTGEPATIVSAEITHQASDSGTIIPSGSWETSVPPVTPGRYLWTRQVLQFNTGAPITSYSVSRFGIDGTGAVSTVAGVAPDETGNVPLDASSVKAMAITGGTMEGAINMNGQKLSGLNAPTTDSEVATKGYADEQVASAKDYADEQAKKAAPYNYAHNSDFTQFVAQAGIGGNHGTQAYAGDRWILDSGTVTGEVKEDGNGYANIKLTGTIRQIVENAPDVGTAAIEMVSGTADISYANGQITITSNGGVIKNVRLFKGNIAADNMAAYQPKGYGAELAECQRYFLKADIYIVGLCYTDNGDTRWNYHPPIEMRKIPTISAPESLTTLAVSSNGIATNVTITPMFSWTNAGVIVRILDSNTVYAPTLGGICVVGSSLVWLTLSADL